MDEQSRRRLDRVLDPAFVSGLDDATTDELRTRLRESRDEEAELSCLRRLLHGRMDILRAELEARRGGRGTVRGLDMLRDALAEAGPAGHRGARAPIATQVLVAQGRRRAERIISDDHLARLPDLGLEEIEGVIEGAKAEERLVSGQRRSVFAVIDALETQLAARYREGLGPPV